MHLFYTTILRFGRRFCFHFFVAPICPEPMMSLVTLSAEWSCLGGVGVKELTVRTKEVVASVCA